MKKQLKSHTQKKENKKSDSEHWICDEMGVLENITTTGKINVKMKHERLKEKEMIVWY